MSQTQIETLDAATSTLTVSVDIDLYPRDALYAAAYVFLDRAYVVLDREGERLLVHLRGKQTTDETTLRAMAGEFENELLAQALRHRVFKANQHIIEQVTALAISGAGGSDHDHEEIGFQGSVDDGMDFLDDPLGIAKPWENKKEEA